MPSSENRKALPYQQIRIFNGGNPPLQLGGVTIFRRETSLVFQTAMGRAYKLIGGNANARAPSYDLAEAVRGIGELRVPTVAPGVIVSHKTKDPMSPWTERHGAFIWAALIVAVSLLSPA